MSIIIRRCIYETEYLAGVSTLLTTYTEPCKLSYLLSGGDSPLQEQQPLLTSKLGTQHHGSHHQGRGCLDRFRHTPHQRAIARCSTTRTRGNTISIT